MNKKFIIDKEVNLNESDFLHTKVYSDNLTRIINNTESNKVFTIGLFGSWGSGKSSIIETSSKDFDQSKIKFISYDAWQYANDSFRRMFLRKVRKDLGFTETELMKKFYENESAEVGNKFQLSTTRLSFILISILLLIILLWALPITYETKIPLYSLFSIVGLFITVLSGAFHQLKVSITKPLFFAPEQFEACFKEMISGSLKKYKWYENAIFTIIGENTVKNLDKLVIVIDNIDRCNNDVAYNLLTDIKTFLSNQNYSVVFVIPIDDEALRKHLFRLNKNDDEDISAREKEEFLRKFFNVIIRIKPYQETDMFSFAQSIDRKFELGFKSETLNLAAKEYSTNPRRVIQLFNNLISELSNYNDEFSKKYESIICICIILREEFNEYYKEIVNAPKIFLDDFLINDKINRQKELRFHRITRNLVKDISLHDFSFILTNSSNHFNELAIEEKEAIISFDTSKVISILGEISDEKKKDKIIDYIIHQIRISWNNKLHNDLTTYFDLVSEVSIKYNFEFQINNRFLETFSLLQEYIIENTSHYDNMCKYALLLQNQGLSNFKEAIIEKTIKSNTTLKFWPTLFNSVLEHFFDNESSKKLADTYFNNFPVVDKELQLSPEQYKHLISELFIEKRIEEIKHLSEADTSQDLLWTILKNKKELSDELFETYFKKIDYLLGEKIDRSQEEVLNIIEYVNSIFNYIPNKLLEYNCLQLNNVYTKLKTRQVYTNSTRTRTNNVNIFDEAISNNNNNLYIYVRYLINIFRITNNKITVIDELVKFPNSHLFGNEILELINSDYSLEALKELIIKNDDYSNELNIDILKALFLQNASNGFIDSTTVKQKFESVLNFALIQKNTKAFDFLEESLEFVDYRHCLSDIIISLESYLFELLPPIFLELAIQSFNYSRYKEFEKNFDFLKMVASRGKVSQLELLTTLLTNKIDRNEDIDNVLILISSVKEIKKTDKKLLLSHLESYLEKYKHELADETKIRITKILKSLEQ